MKLYTNTGVKVLLSVALAVAILYWMYRGYDFSALRAVVAHEMNWGWMVASLPFGILAQACRGWRWQQTLAPLGEHPRGSVAVSAIFISYAVSLAVPRVGEFVRCGVLTQKERVSFVKALGTVVTERVIDTLLLLLLLAFVVLSQFTIFSTFFHSTGFNVPSLLRHFTWQGYLVTALCLVVAAIFLHLLLRKMTFYDHLRRGVRGLWEGIISLRRVKNFPLFLVLTVGIWLCYFLHYYLTFFCFSATSHLGIVCALVTFAVGTVAVIVPTPNGAGPWHFAVKTMLFLYGVAEEQALYFVFIVHAVQTLFVVVLGLYGWLHITLIHKSHTNNQSL